MGIAIFGRYPTAHARPMGIVPEGIAAPFPERRDLRD
jgi:hypothetical protein